MRPITDPEVRFWRFVQPYYCTKNGRPGRACRTCALERYHRLKQNVIDSRAGA